MRKVLFILVFCLLLAGCSDEISIHEDVDEGIAKDTIQSIDIVMEAIENHNVAEDLPEEDLRTMAMYKERYEEEYQDIIKETDKQIVMKGVTIVSQYARSSLLQSEIDEIEEDIDDVEEMISTGEPRYDN